MAFFSHRWPSRKLRSVLREGITLDWSRLPPELDMGEYAPKSPQEEEAIRHEQEDLFNKRAVELAKQRPHCVLTQFCIQKKGSAAMRPILNMKVLSPFINSPHFKMEGIRAAKEILRRGDWMCRVDLKDAYLHVGVRWQDRKYLQYRYKGTLFQWRVLPFGYRDAPRFFQKLMVEALASLRRQGMRIVIYLDDILLMEATQSGCKQARDKLLARLIYLGFATNLEKSDLVPKQTITFLGLRLSSTDLTISLPLEKVQSCTQTINKVLRRAAKGRDISLWELQSLLGTLQSTSECMLHHRLRLNSVFETLNQARLSSESRTTLQEQAKEDLCWWRDNMSQWNGRCYIPPTPDHVVEVDASDMGIGGVVVGEPNPLTTHLFLEPHQHINCRELFAAVYSLRAFATQAGWAKCTVKIRTDNSVAAIYINRVGGRIPALSRLTEQLHKFALTREIRVFAEWIPGKDNTAADRLSRIRDNYADKMLHPVLFRQIERTFGKPQIDLFASIQNRQVPRYVSLRAEEESWYVDTFARPLPAGLRMYAFPPFSLVGRLLAKIRREKAQMILVVPAWTKQPWWPDLQDLMVGTHLELKRKEGLFLLPTNFSQQAVTPPTWRLIACRVSARNS